MSETESTESLKLTVKEAATMVGTTIPRIKQMIKTGKLNPVDTSRTVRLWAHEMRELAFTRLMKRIANVESAAQKRR